MSFHFNSKIEEKQPFNVGLPQGSPLSPILFLIYAQVMMEEDYPERGTISYMDDDALSALDKNFRLTSHMLETKANTRVSREEKLNLEYEPSKTTLLHFHSPGKSPKDLIRATVTSNRITHSSQPFAKHLVIYLDEGLNFSKHYSEIRTKIQ